MRRLPLLLLLVAAAGSAQTLPDPSPLLEALGLAWEDVASRLPDPTSGAVVDGRGVLHWDVDTEELAGVSAKVLDGRVASVRVEWHPDALGDLKRLQGMVRDRVGAPDSGAYYSADQIGRMPGDAPPMELAIRVGERAAYFRAPSE